ncbi:MAG: 3-phosphoserine/phosphohydroxythreonine transaminase [Bacillota bacterium]
MGRVYNFNPGPSALPLPVLETVQRELLDYKGNGISVMEMSHRSPQFEEINREAESLVLENAGLAAADYRVLFLQGGASLQFSMIPMNFLSPQAVADYVVTGSFAEKAYKEAKKLGNVHVAATTKESNYSTIPRQEELQFSEKPAYVHITSNNTIYGIQWHYIPDCGDTPLVVDMSSDILSRELDMSRFSLIYAGAQKNMGPSGVTVVIIRKSMLEQASDATPSSMLSYKIHAENDSLYNTPCTFGIYIIRLIMQWVKDMGGIKVLGGVNKEKADLIYDAIDASSGFYRGHAAKEARSGMNITFRLPDAELEKKFAAEAAKAEMIGLKGHRSVGGIRASIYNAMPLEGCRALASFMHEFARRNG